MTKLLFFAIPLKHIRGLESGTEKLLHNTTITILLFFCVLLASKPLFGSPITCQVPKDWPSSSVDYFTDICYYGNRQKGNISRSFVRRNGDTMYVNYPTGSADYYMWVPLFPVLQLALCLLPVLFWKFVGLECFHGADIVSCLEYYTEEGSKEGKDIVDTVPWRVQKLVVQLENWIAIKKTAKWGLSRTLILYVLMKWFRLFIFIFQLWLMASLFGRGSLFWGLENTMEIFNGSHRHALEGEFTLISSCTVQRLQLGIGELGIDKMNINSVHARCILSANFLNAKAFLILYWWFVFVSVISLLSALHYTLILFIAPYRRHKFQGLIKNESYYIEQHGEPHPELKLGKSEPLEYLVDHLGNDGFLVFQMVYEMMGTFSLNKLADDFWRHVIVHNRVVIPDDEELEKEKKKEGEVPAGDMKGSGDRNHGGKDFKYVTKSADAEQSSSSPSLSMVSCESDTDPLISPAVFRTMYA